MSDMREWIKLFENITEGPKPVTKTAKVTTWLEIPGVKLQAPNRSHRPAIWENMLGTVYAMNDQFEVQYFDYDWDAAKKFAGLENKKDLRLFKHKKTDVRHDWEAKKDMWSHEYPRKGKTVLWVEKNAAPVGEARADHPLTHGNIAISHASNLTPDEVVVGDYYDMGDGGKYKIVSKSRNHFKVRNMGSAKTWMVAYKGNEHLVKPDYYKHNTRYIPEELVDEAVVEVPDGLRGERHSNMTRADAERFIAELNPEDTPDTEVVDPESGEVLDWPDRNTRQAQDDAALQAELDAEAEKYVRHVPYFSTPKNYDEAWDVISDFRDSDFYVVHFEELSELVDDPDELRNADYDVDVQVPTMLRRSDRQKLTSEDHRNIAVLMKAARLGSTMGNVAVEYVGMSNGGTVARFVPTFM